LTELVDHLADLTGLRDRDTLDVSLVGALRDLLSPQCAAVHRVVSDEDGHQHWLTRARQTRDDPVATGDPAWTDLRTLPELSEQPLWVQCRTEGDLVVGPQIGSLHQQVFPVVSDSGVAGVLELLTDEPLNDMSVRMVHGILRVYRNLQGLLDYSERDTLTNLLNRKSFDETFYKASAIPLVHQEQPARANDQRRGDTAQVQYFLGVADIDFFKKVNDTFGHLIGDEVLLLVSRIMRGAFRFYDQLYRFGGEEFVILLRCTDEDDAQSALERFRRIVEDYSFPQVQHITVSLGFTDVRPGDTPAAAFERADQAVYHAKHHGRNMVCSHARLVREGHLTDDTKSSDVELF